MAIPQVLLVQNSLSSAKILSDILEDNSFHVIDMVQNQEDALLNIKDKNPDLIIMDFKTNSEAILIDEMQKINSIFRMPVVFLIDDINENELERINILLPYNLLKKPFKDSDLILTLKASLYIHEMTVKVKESEEQLLAILSALVTILIGVDNKDSITLWNNIAETTFGIPASLAIGELLMKCRINWDWERLYEGIAQSIIDNKPVKLDDLRYINSQSKDGFLDIRVNPIKDKHGKLNGFLITGEDITKRRQLEQQLSQAQKLESIGRLSAGIAHEINTPTQYITDNIYFLKNSFSNILETQVQSRNLIDLLKNGFDVEDLKKSVNELFHKNNIEYLTSEIPKAIDQSIEGLNRVANIVHSMKQFSHPGTNKKIPTDINRAIENTITITRNEWKYSSEVVADYDEKIPPVLCFPWEFNQVILNLITNASDAIKEKAGTDPKQKGLINIRTGTEGNMAVIEIKDSGSGIQENIQTKIFDPFFTTKSIGKGTGQGLSIAYDIIVNKHNGKIDFESKQGEGTKFKIQIPIIAI